MYSFRYLYTYIYTNTYNYTKTYKRMSNNTKYVIIEEHATVQCIFLFMYTFTIIIYIL